MTQLDIVQGTYSRTMVSVFLQLTLTMKRLHFKIVYIKNIVLYIKHLLGLCPRYKTVYLNCNRSLDNRSLCLKDIRRGGDNGHGLKR